MRKRRFQSLTSSYKSSPGFKEKKANLDLYFKYDYARSIAKRVSYKTENFSSFATSNDSNHD